MVLCTNSEPSGNGIEPRSWPLVSVVVVGYRRPDLLASSVRSLLNGLRYPRLELVLADDGSPSEMQAEMRALPFDKYIFGPHGGIGANSNRGLLAASGTYILQIQDDWDFNGPADLITNAVIAMERYPDIGIFRFYGTEDLLVEHSRAIEGTEVNCEVFSWKQDRSRHTFLYSDTPHLKRATLHTVLGGYSEGRTMQATETDFSRRFNESRYFRAAGFASCRGAFVHTGASRSHRRPDIRTRVGGLLARMPFGAVLRSALRRRARTRPL